MLLTALVLLTVAAHPMPPANAGASEATVQVAPKYAETIARPDSSASTLHFFVTVGAGVGGLYSLNVGIEDRPEFTQGGVAISGSVAVLKDVDRSRRFGLRLMGARSTYDGGTPAVTNFAIGPIVQTQGLWMSATLGGMRLHRLFADRIDMPEAGLGVGYAWEPIRHVGLSISVETGTCIFVSRAAIVLGAAFDL